MEKLTRAKAFLDRLTEKKYFLFIASIPWVILCFILFNHFLKNGYIGLESNDDLYMNMISSGAYGFSDAHNIYSNIILGFIYSFFYRILPAHNWNTLIQLATIMGSYIVLGIWNIVKNKPIKGYLTSLILLSCTFKTMICKVNYSKTGALALLTGFVLLVYSLNCDEWKSIKLRLLRVLSYMFIIWGSLFRKDTMIACIPFLFIMMAFVVLKYKKESLLRLIPFVGVIAALALCWLCNYIAYNSDEGWKHFTEYNEARTELLDFGMPIYYSYVEEYGELGLSENDYNQFKKWRFAEENVFSLDTLNKLIELRDANAQKKSIIIKIKDSFTLAESLNFTYIIRMSLLFSFFTYLVATVINRKKNCFYITASFLLCIAEELVLISKGRIVERALYLPMIAFFITVLFFIDEEVDEYKSRLTNFFVLVCALMFAFYAGGIRTASADFEDKVYDKTDANTLFSYTADNKDNLYIMDISANSLLLFLSYSPLDHLDEIPHDNIALMGGWMVPAPAVTRIAGSYTDEYNLFKAMATNDNVFWISDISPEYDDFVFYMQEHYGKECKIIETVGKFYICSFAQNSY